MTIRHARGSYEVTFGPIREVLDYPRPATFVITDANVGKLIDTDGLPTLQLPAGETTKSLIWLEACCSWLASQRAGRDATLMALGGGVIGDLVGFVAATYMRGVRYVQVPTTLLAQVDSSVGGKVAVDIPSGKNLVGAFYPPEQVWVDPQVLSTLSVRQFRNGMAEVLKTGFIARPDLLEIQRGEVATLVEACIAHKAMVVQEDEFETTGLRATLNFGHTIGHAIEQVTRYVEVLHGEAISVGMVLESRLGERIGITEPGTTEIVSERLEREGLPTAWPTHLHVEALVEAMKRDKKSKAGRLNMSLLTQIGGCKLVSDIPESEVIGLLRSV